MTDKERQIDTIIYRAVQAINKNKGTSLKLSNSFGLCVDKDAHADQLAISVTVTISNPANNNVIKLLFTESWFDADCPKGRDEQAGISKLRDKYSKVVLRIAYSIWINIERLL